MADQGLLVMAGKDADAAKTLFDIDSERYAEVIAFHCQQASEKMLKQALIDAGLAFEPIHKLNRLLAPLCETIGVEPEAALTKAAERLTVHAVNTRYSAALDVGRAEALRAMEDCDAISLFLESNGFGSVGRLRKREEEGTAEAEDQYQPSLHEIAEQVKDLPGRISSPTS